MPILPGESHKAVVDSGGDSSKIDHDNVAVAILASHLNDWAPLNYREELSQVVSAQIAPS
ncbi:MAG TPA: hypothetical protein VHV28_07080 [Solirubrobacteraceae bacterium]|nr:hypothetical protein [Solirubrobacteraceae bacterium]